MIGSDNSRPAARNSTDGKFTVTKREAVAAAKARVAADKLRGVTTDQRIIDLSQRKVS